MSATYNVNGYVSYGDRYDVPRFTVTADNLDQATEAAKAHVATRDDGRTVKFGHLDVSPVYNPTTDRRRHVTL